jgi:hypothetical protein
MIGDTILHGCRQLAAAGLLFALVVGSGSCGDRLAPDGGHDGEAPVAVVSNPVTAGALAATASAAVLAPAVAYVSLAPGTYPTGVAATISNRRTGTGLRVGLVAGGLDPVPIAAEAGDTLAFAIDTGGVQPARFDQLVPLFMRPVVVRTDPPPGKRDVPLNSIVVVVFSEPMDPASLTGATLGLEQGGTPVEGEVTVSADELEVIFQAAADLLPATDYTIVVRNGIRDSDGSELGAPLTADFTTVPSGTAPSGAIEVVVVASGTDVDGEYAATLDGARPFPLLEAYPAQPDRPTYLPGVPAGNHVVSLVPPVNCSVKDGPRSVALTAGDLIRVAFSVTCVPFLGTVRISAPTTGPIPNSTRYRVMHEEYGAWDYGGDFTDLGTLEPNGTLVVQTPMDKWGGIYWHDFAMWDVPATCIVQGPNPTERDTLTFGDTLDVEFPVTCSPPSGGR